MRHVAALNLTLGFMTKTHPHNFEGHDSMNDPWADNYQYSEELALKGRDAEMKWVDDTG